MSVYFDAGVGFGYHTTLDEVLRPWLKTTEEVSHLEERFDPKTGKSVGQVKVVDEFAEQYVEFKGGRYELDEVNGFIEALNKELNANGLNCNVTMYGDDCTELVAFQDREVSDLYSGDGVDFDNTMIGDSMKLPNEGLVRNTLQIGEALEKLGIYAHGPHIFPIWNIN